MNTSGNATLKIVPATGADQQIEVIIDEADGRVALRYSTWTDGLGWCAQKTIWLDGAQLDHLHRALTVARARLRRVHGEEKAVPAKIIHLPIIAHSRIQT
ncbi:MAG: hypothetical protein C4334_09085 [Pyrinomonas sp.]|uniref:hypothetical protein n=1 Tax=Pyrinomonas sp. TaxID=2080306 RepID=UPI00331F51E8